MINKSIWLKGIKSKKGNSLKENIETDILIIGGGITGITTAYYLKDSNLKVTIVDSNKIGFGQSSKATGKLTYLQGLLLNKIEKIYDTDTAIKYLISQKEAIDLVKDIIIENNIKCDYESNNSYLFTLKEANANKIKNIEKILKKANIKYKTTSSIPIKYPCKYAVKVDDTAVFNPVKYILGLKDIIEDNINIYENTIIKEIINNDTTLIAKSDKYLIKAKKIIIACHYPFFINPYFFPFKTSLNKGYLCACKTDKVKRFNAISEDDNTHSIRFHSDSKDYIIFAGEERNIGTNIDNEEKYDNLFWKVKSRISEDIKYCWSNFDIMTNDSLPIIGYLNEEDNNILIGTGYNAWGMTNGTLAGKVLSDLVLLGSNKYKDLFNPNRLFNINKIKNYFSFNFKTGMNYVMSKINKNQKFYKNVEVRYENGKNYGVYKDQNGKEHIVSNLCPHMGCSLIFNMVEKTWDCPCHGSRFDINGKVIKGPSIYSIAIEKKHQ